MKGGDTVKIKENVNKQVYEHDGPGYIPDMDECLGKTGTVVRDTCNYNIPVNVEGIVRYWRKEDLELIRSKMQKGDKVRVIEQGTLGCGMEGIINDFIYDQDLQITIIEVKFPGGVVNLYFKPDLKIIEE